MKGYYKGSNRRCTGAVMGVRAGRVEDLGLRCLF